MKIQFKKGKEKSTLHCIRKDGSVTWTTIHLGMEIHDLAHFVVETELQFKNAFYGLVASGYTIQDFALPRSQRPEALLPKNLPEEALQTEHIVNLLQIEFQGNLSEFNVLKQLDNILNENNIPFPKMLNEEKIKLISKNLNELSIKLKPFT